MNYLVLDVETSTKNGGNPFTPSNRLCLLSWATPVESGWLKIDYDEEPYGKQLEFLRTLVSNCDLVIGFNFKFDLHWLRRYHIEVGDRRVWDCQLVEFMLNRQLAPFPSLDETLEKHELGKKLDIVKTEYWDKGIDTPDIPLEILSEYGLKDAELTRALFIKQYEIVREQSKEFRSLVSLSNADLVATAEMEWNGMLLDVDGCCRESAVVGTQIDEATRELFDFFGTDWVNLDSPKQLSTLLFGGEIVKEYRTPIGVFKTGQKIGETRYKVVREPHVFRQLVKPLKGSELAGGGYSTSEDCLRSLRPGSKRVAAALDTILRRSKLEKLRGTYYDGLPKLFSGMEWEGNYLHGQINHCVARTGRTSSSKPNMQNLPPEIDKLFLSRFGDEGMVVAADAKGLEWVAVIYLSQDPIGMEEVLAGVDQHENNKERFKLPEKRVAKYFVFRLIFGGTAYTYTVDPDFNWISTKESFWQEIVDSFYEKYAGIKTAHTEWKRDAVERGGLHTPTGRMFSFYPDSGGRWPDTTIKNYPVQSLGHDIMAIIRVSLHRRFKEAGFKSKIVNTVHDSIVLDIFKKEWYNIHTMIEEVFADMPKNFEKLFGKTFNLPMKVEVKRLDGGEIENISR